MGGWQHIVGPIAEIGKWTHVAGAYDGRKMVLYLNGIEVGQKLAKGKINIIEDPVGIGNIVENLPLVYASSAALRFYDRVLVPVFISTNARCRALGVVIAPVAMALFLLPFGDGPLAAY